MASCWPGARCVNVCVCSACLTSSIDQDQQFTLNSSSHFDLAATEAMQRGRFRYGCSENWATGWRSAGAEERKTSRNTNVRERLKILPCAWQESAPALIVKAYMLFATGWALAPRAAENSNQFSNPRWRHCPKLVCSGSFHCFHEKTTSKLPLLPKKSRWTLLNLCVQLLQKLSLSSVWQQKPEASVTWWDFFQYFLVALTMNSLDRVQSQKQEAFYRFNLADLLPQLKKIKIKINFLRQTHEIYTCKKIIKKKQHANHKKQSCSLTRNHFQHTPGLSRFTAWC